MKILEKDLQDRVKIFENEDILLKFDVVIQGQLEFRNVNIRYNTQTSYLQITDTTNDNELRINIANAYEINLECSNLHILLDSEIELMIMKK